VQTGEAGHICRKLAFGESETKMLRMDDLFKGLHFDWEIIILCVRWYLRFKLSFRDLVEMMAERGISLAHTTIMRWIARWIFSKKSAGLLIHVNTGHHFVMTGGIIPFWATTSIGIGTQTFRATPNRGQF